MHNIFEVSRMYDGYGYMVVMGHENLPVDSWFTEWTPNMKKGVEMVSLTAAFRGKASLI